MKKQAILIFVFISILSFKALTAQIPKKFVKIPAGEVYIENLKIPVDEFYIYKTEISNKEYREFLEYHRENKQISELGEEENINWENLVNEFVHLQKDDYPDNEKYDNYPVVNITYEAANLFCKWLTELYRKEINENITVKLPSKMQWIRAAKGDNPKNVYAWETSSIYSEDSTLLRNYKEDEFPSIDSVYSYQSNQFGLYNMSGNVAEMTNRKGVGLGGHWNHSAPNGKTEDTFMYNYISPMLGFRPIMIIK